jgi:molecular chaperone IbpA
MTLMQEFLNRSVGWDCILDEFANNKSTFPPHSISATKDGRGQIDIALAGYSRDDIDVVFQDGVLSISSDGVDKPEDMDYAYNGIAKRKFRSKFAIAEHHKIENASMENGMLTIKVVEVLPEHKQPQVIAIN